MAKIVFMGTPEFALPSLSALMATHDVVAVVTQPDRPAGRKKRLRQSPVKRLAQSAGINIMQPARMRKSNVAEALEEYKADLHVIVAYGQILPQAVLDVPRYGTINVHASLLPRWRGAAPIQAAIRAGERQSGATVMLLDAGLDTGPILAKRALELAPEETGLSLHDKLAQLGADLLVDTLPHFLSCELDPQPQDESQATYAPQIKKEEGEIDWSEPARSIDRQVRAFTPWPGTFTAWNETTLKVIAGCAGDGAAKVGQVIEREGAIAIGTGDGLYFPSELQLAGKKRLTVLEFLNGYGEIVGATLGGNPQQVSAE